MIPGPIPMDGHQFWNTVAFSNSVIVSDKQHS